MVRVVIDFVQQCKMLLHVIEWCESGPLVIGENGRSLVINASYDFGEFAPNLDFELALNFHALL